MSYSHNCNGLNSCEKGSFKLVTVVVFYWSNFTISALAFKLINFGNIPSNINELINGIQY